MSQFRYTKAKRDDVKVLIGIAAASEGGKTWSSMVLADALSGNLPFACVDTERNRAKHYSDDFDFEHFPLGPPFAPARFLEKVKEIEKRGFPAAIIDSTSHEWSGIGGVRNMAENASGESAAKWAKPKEEHFKMLNGLLQADIHIIFCLRAREKIKFVPNPENPKKNIVVPIGWQPICERDFMYELTLSFTLIPDEPGVIQDSLPGKCPDKFRPQFMPGTQISSEAGHNLRKWCNGATLPWPRELLSDAMNAAQQGSVRFRDWSHSTSEDDRVQLTPYRRKLIETAKKADFNLAGTLAPPEPVEDEPDRPAADDYSERYEENNEPEEGTEYLGDEGAMPALDGQDGQDDRPDDPDQPQGGLGL